MPATKRSPKELLDDHIRDELLYDNRCNLSNPWDYEDVDPDADKYVVTNIVRLIDAFGGEKIAVSSHMKHDPYSNNGDPFVWKAKIIKPKGSTEDGPLAEAVKSALCQEVLMERNQAWGAYDDATMEIFLKAIENYAQEKGILDDDWVVDMNGQVVRVYWVLSKTQKEAEAYCLA